MPPHREPGFEKLDAIAVKLGLDPVHGRKTLWRWIRDDPEVAAVIQRRGHRYEADVAALAALLDERAEVKRGLAQIAAQRRWRGKSYPGVKVFLYWSRKAGYVVRPEDIPPEPPDIFQKPGGES
jgi:hypothetical protein